MLLLQLFIQTTQHIQKRNTLDNINTLPLFICPQSGFTFTFGVVNIHQNHNVEYIVKETNKEKEDSVRFYNRQGKIKTCRQVIINYY